MLSVALAQEKPGVEGGVLFVSRSSLLPDFAHPPRNSSGDRVLLGEGGNGRGVHRCNGTSLQGPAVHWPAAVL